MITIPAGALYYSRDWLNGYNLVQLDLMSGEFKIVLRRYSKAKREWVKDVQSTGDKLGGEFEATTGVFSLISACRNQ